MNFLWPKICWSTMKCCLEVTMDLETGEASKSGNTAQHSVTHLDHCGHYPPSYCGCDPGSCGHIVARVCHILYLRPRYGAIVTVLQCYTLPASRHLTSGDPWWCLPGLLASPAPVLIPRTLNTHPFRLRLTRRV